MNTRNKQTDTANMKGAAVVELAVVLPLLLTIVFGIIEFGWVFMVRETLVNASREGCRVAVLQGSTQQDVTDQVDASMAGAGLSSYSVQITSSTPGNPNETVQVLIPYADVSLLGGYFGGTTNFNLTATTVMRKEGAD
jgi:Flp pilus assembly protein TadG